MPSLTKIWIARHFQGNYLKLPPIILTTSFPGFLFSASIVDEMEAEKRDPGNEAVILTVILLLIILF